MIGVGIELRGLDEMQRELERMAKKAVPYAAREMLNGLAFAGRAIWQDEMRASLTLRNAFTTRRAIVRKVTGYKMAEMQAVLGHTEEYMLRLEYGAGDHATGEAVAIPTEVAAGQAKGSLPGGRQRPVKKAFYLRAIPKLRRQSKAIPREARNARAIQQGIKDGSRLAYLEFQRRKGIYRLKGGKRNPEILKVYDLTHPFVPRPRKPMLQRTIDKALLQAPALGLAAVMRQLDRHRIGT